MLVTLNVTAGPHSGRTFSFRQHDTFIVGRAAYAHFRLETRDKYFSRAHFLVEVNPPLCRLIDMGSMNGTYVNDAKVSEVDLKDGDRIRGGKTTLKVNIELAGGPEDTVSLDLRTVPDFLPERNAHRQLERSAPLRTTTSEKPRLIGPYQIKRELGRGGMGVVYLATRESDQVEVALKTVRPKVEVPPNELKRFLREASILESLDHAGIVKYYEGGTSDGQVYLAMEYVRGLNLSAAIQQQGIFAIGRAVALICQLLDAVQYAHGRGFVHRDIKPGNILLAAGSGGDRVKLADFGLARVYRESKMSGLTLQGDIGGTIAFAAPEQITNFRETKPTSDLYSVGATLYMMLTGHTIYDFPKALNRQVLMLLQEQPIPIQARRLDVPDGLTEVIHCSLARQPEHRFPDAASMRRALLPFIA